MSVAGEPACSGMQAQPALQAEEGRAHSAPAGEEFCTLTQRDLEELADRQARDLLNVRDRQEAFEMLSHGKLRGTILEAEFSMLRALIEA